MAAGKKTGGRQKGTPNKATASVKENIVAVFTRLGSTAAMAKWAERNPDTFYRAYMQLAPKEIDLKGDVTADVKVAWDK